MTQDRLISLPEMERTMKRQEVILRAMSGEIKWYQAAQILGISDRQMHRVKCGYEKYGYDDLVDRRKCVPSPNRIPMEVAEKIVRLYREEYFDFNVKHFHEELQENHDVGVSYSWTKVLLQGAGLVKKAKKRGKYRRRRERKPLTGMMMHLDGSQHHWFGGSEDEQQTLLAILDDATSKCLWAKFFPSEGTLEVLEGIAEVVQKHGTFISLYVDRASHFVYTPKAGGPPNRSVKTQVEQVLDELGIELIAAMSPEARGRSERNWRTMQGRLPQELRRAGATDYNAANQYLCKVFVRKFNRLFSVKSKQEGTAFIPVVGVDIKRIFALRHERTVNKDNTISFNNRMLQLPKVRGVATLAKRKVEIREHLDGVLCVYLGRRLIAEFDSEQQKRTKVIVA